MILTLQRTETSDEGTFGKLTGGGLSLATIELPNRDNQCDVSCIPDGEYQCTYATSPKFGPDTIHINNGQGRTNVLIHAANFAGDTSKGYQSDLLGCIAPGLAIGQLANKSGKLQKAVLSSKAALQRINAVTGGEPFTLCILNAPQPKTDMV